MAALTPIAIADLGAGLDALPTAVGVTGRWVSMGPQLLMIAARVITAAATVRLYRYDAELLRWVPSAVVAQVLDPAVDAGLYELRFNTAAIDGLYALVQTAGAGVVSYYVRPGRN